MQTEFDLSAAVPYGALHDQTLTAVRCAGNQMTFTFAVQLFADDVSPQTYQKYSAFTHCDMTVNLVSEPFNYFLLETAVSRRGKYRGRSLSRADFSDAVLHAGRFTWIECAAACKELHILFGAQFGRAKGKYRKYRKYGMCRVELNAESVQWTWY